MASYLRPRRGKKSTAIKQNFVLKRGEVFFEAPESGIGKGIGKIKMGDGSTPYKDLPYFVEDTVKENHRAEYIISGTLKENITRKYNEGYRGGIFYTNPISNYLPEDRVPGDTHWQCFKWTKGPSSWVHIIATLDGHNTQYIKNIAIENSDGKFNDTDWTSIKTADNSYISICNESVYRSIPTIVWKHMPSSEEGILEIELPEVDDTCNYELYCTFAKCTTPGVLCTPIEINRNIVKVKAINVSDGSPFTGVILITIYSLKIPKDFYK